MVDEGTGKAAERCPASYRSLSVSFFGNGLRIKYKDRLLRNLSKRAKEFGLQLTPLETVTPLVSSKEAEAPRPQRPTDQTADLEKIFRANGAKYYGLKR